MRSWQLRSPIGRLLTITTLLSAMLLGLQAAPAQAKSLKDRDTSLQFIPADAAYYATLMRNREQFEIVANSKAWASIKQMPIVQFGWQMVQLQSAGGDSGPAKIRKALEDPQVKQALKLVVDMLSDEVFLYTDASAIDAIELMQEIGNSVRTAQLRADIGTAGDDGPDYSDMDEDEAVGAALLRTLAKNRDQIKAPVVVHGFKLSDTKRATEQLAKLELMVGLLCEQVPELEGSFGRKEIAGNEYLVLSLDGEMIPWEESTIEEMKEAELKEGDAEEVIEAVKEATLSVAVGLRDDYLLLAIGPDTEALKRLGSGDLLVDRPEMKRLDKHAGEKLTGIAYVSEEMNRRLGDTSSANLKQLQEMADALLAEADLPEGAKREIRNDVDRFLKDVQTQLPEAGAVAAVSFLQPKGIEAYTYDFGEKPGLDGSKALPILEHLGGRPLLGVAGRATVSIDDYDLLVKWLEIGYSYFDRYAVPEMDEDERAKYQRFADMVGPILVHLDEVNRTTLLPSLDGQHALVVDAQMKSKQYLDSLPATDEALPMAEPALVLGLSDRQAFFDAMVEYHKAMQQIADAIQQVAADEAPEIDVPDPAIRDRSAGSFYEFALPGDWGVDEQIAPAMALSDEFAVFAASPKHATRLLEATPAKAGLLRKAKGPLAMAVAFEWAHLVETATPWVDLATREILADDGEVDEDQLESVGDQVHTVLDVLKTLVRVTSVSRFEDGALVSHSLTEISDTD